MLDEQGNLKLEIDKEGKVVLPELPELDEKGQILMN